MKRGHTRDNYDSSQKRKEAIEAKRMQVATTKALLEMWEHQENYNHKTVLRLRAKLRQKRNELCAMDGGGYP